MIFLDLNKKFLGKTKNQRKNEGEDKRFTSGDKTSKKPIKEKIKIAESVTNRLYKQGLHASTMKMYK